MDCKSGETQNEAIEIDDKTDDNDWDFWVRNEMVSLKNDCKIQIDSGEMLDDRVSKTIEKPPECLLESKDSETDTVSQTDCDEIKTTDEPLLTHSKEFLQNDSSDSKHHGTSDDNKLTQSENSSDDLGKLSEERALRYDSSEKEIGMSNNCESESLIHNSMAEISASFSSGEEENTTENLPEINIPIVKSRIGRPKGSNKPFRQF